MNIKKVELLKKYLEEKKKLVQFKEEIENQIGCSILDEISDNVNYIEVTDIYSIVDTSDKLECKTVSDCFSLYTQVGIKIEDVLIFQIV